MNQDWPLHLANVIRLSSALLLIFCVLPNAYKELMGKHKDLGGLPSILFLLIVIYMLSIIMITLVSVCRTGVFCFVDGEYALNFVSVVTSFGTLSSAVAWYLIYSQKY